MTEAGKQPNGRVFVLRVWTDGQDGRPAPNRYILEDPFSKARRGFATLSDLTAYLDTLPPATKDDSQ